MFYPRHTVAEIDLEAIASNLAQIKSLLQAETKIMPIIKANAYGHGAVMIARALENMGIDMFGVSCVYEVIELRNAGIKSIIVNVDPTMLDDVEAVFEYDYQPTVFSLEVAQKISQIAAQKNKIAKIHLKVDTGMNRAGIGFEDAVDLVRKIKTLPNIEIVGLFTHFANADDLNSDYTTLQLARFENVLQQLQNLHIKIPFIHAANSAGILFWPKSHFNLVRLGIALYGYSPDAKISEKLKPILTLKSYISHIKKLKSGEAISYGGKFVTKKDSLIATIPIGYADGFRRSPQNWQEVLVQGKRCAIVGTICMDQTMIDVSEINGLQVGDEVVLIGKQGDAKITADEIAQKCGTISYEILSGLALRITRVYK